MDTPALDLALTDGHLVTHLPVRWGDLDPYRHVNNVAVLGLLEEARVVTLWRMGRPGELASNAIAGGTDAQLFTYVVHSEVAYRSPLLYTGEPVRVEVWFTHLGAADVEVAYAVTAPGQGANARPAVLATTRLAIIDPETNRPTRIPTDVRAAWEPLLGERPRLSSRRH